MPIWSSVWHAQRHGLMTNTFQHYVNVLFCAGWFNKQPIVNDQRGALWETCSDAYWLIVCINITCSTLADMEQVFWMASLKTLWLTDKKNMVNKHWWTIKDAAQQWVPTFPATLVPKSFSRLIFSRRIKKKIYFWTNPIIHISELLTPRIIKHYVNKI